MRCSFIWLEFWKEDSSFGRRKRNCFLEAMFHYRMEQEELVGSSGEGNGGTRTILHLGQRLGESQSRTSLTGQQCTDTRRTGFVLWYHQACFSKGTPTGLEWKSFLWEQLYSNHGFLKIPVFPGVPHEQLYLIFPGEASKRKRSKSEDMDNVHSKHRRYMGEDYEAELQVQITTRKDVDLKLQKVEQRCRTKNIHTCHLCSIFEFAVLPHTLCVPKHFLFFVVEHRM